MKFDIFKCIVDAAQFVSQRILTLPAGGEAGGGAIRAI
jgi:hypothetical protein